MTPCLSATSNPIEHQHLAEGSVAPSNFVGKNVSKSSVENNIIQEKIRQLEKEGRRFTVHKYSDILSTKVGNITVKKEFDSSSDKCIKLHTDASNKSFLDANALLYRSKGEEKTSIVNFHVIMN